MPQESSLIWRRETATMIVVRCDKPCGRADAHLAAVLRLNGPEAPAVVRLAAAVGRDARSQLLHHSAPAVLERYD